MLLYEHGIDNFIIDENGKMVALTEREGEKAMNNDEDFIYGILSKSLRISTEAARDFVHQMNEYLPNNFPPEVIYSNLLGLPYIYRTPPFVAWSIIARNKLDPGNKLPKPLLPPFIPSIKERKAWVAGIAYENRQTICNRLQIGETVVLRRELFNQRIGAFAFTCPGGRCQGERTAQGYNY